MNNAQFRNLLDTPKPNSTHDAISPTSANQTSRFGSRTRSSMLMTPRSLNPSKSSNNDEFSQQVAQQKRTLQPPGKKPRAHTSVPKGTKFGQGYQDRAALLRQEQSREESVADDEKAERIKALEDMVRLQQIDQATFEKLRDEIGVGGEVGSTHLVKGLDWKLLQRIRRGEDVLATPSSSEREEETPKDNGRDIDEEFDAVLEKDVQPLQKEQRAHKGTTSSRSPVPIPEGQMSRDGILKRLKASRVAAAREISDSVSAGPSLGAKFHGIGNKDPPRKKKLVETVNGRRREVLLISNPNGTTKRKVKWIDKVGNQNDPGAVQPAREALGMEVPAEMMAKQRAILEKKKAEEEEDQDIFAGVGADYDPLGTSADESDESTKSDAGDEAAPMTEKATAKPAESGHKARNYFSTTGAEEEKIGPRDAPTIDPNILAALKKTAAVRKGQEGTATNHNGMVVSENNAAENEFLTRLRKREREDAADLDLGFGESRFGDEEDDEGPIWNDDESGRHQKAGRKRGPKKRKGNKDEVRDVMSVLERVRK